MLKYTGQGEALFGFPAKDMTDEEILKYAKRFLLGTGLYREEKDKQASTIMVSDDKSPKEKVK